MMTTRFFLHLTFFLISLLVIGRAGAVTFPETPPNERFYVDHARLLSAGDAATINKIASSLLEELDIPILVVTIPSLISFQAADYTVDSYAAALFDKWGIGFQKRNYGILLLVSPGDRKARIELGKAWGGRHDADAEYVMDSLMIPAFKRGDFSTGVRDGVNALDKMARGLALPKSKALKSKAPWWTLPAMILLIIMVMVSLYRSGRSGWGWALIVGIGFVIFYILRAAVSSGGSGGGGGSWGAFGGGSSGGGGASGSW